MTYPAKVIKELPLNIIKLVKRDLEAPIDSVVHAFAIETGFKQTTIRRVIESMIGTKQLHTNGEILWIENKRGDTDENES